MTRPAPVPALILALTTRTLVLPVTSRAQPSSWKLWASGLPSGFRPRLAVAPDHAIYGGSLGVIYKAQDALNPTGLLAALPAIPYVTITNNILTLTTSANSEPRHKRQHFQRRLRTMMRRIVTPYIFFLAALLVLGSAPQSSHAYESATVLGQGRYLTPTEQQAFFQHVRQTGSTSEKEKYAAAFERLRALAEPKPVKIEVLDVTRFKSKSVLNEGATPGDQILVICFNCEEAIPAAALATRGKANAKYYDIWVLSATFMVVEQNPKTRSWRVLLEYGGAE